MTGFLAQFSEFHFIRPLWLLLVAAALLPWWLVRSRSQKLTAPIGGLAPHLAAALTVGGESRRRLLPIDGVLVFTVLATLAAAGPTWSRVANPLVAPTAPLAVVLKVSTSMDQVDIAPSRLERAKHKILDLLAGRAGARTALVAYAGTAHRVVPMSEDPEILKPFIQGLSSDVMPRDGADAGAALRLAAEMLSAETTPGAILFVADTIDNADFPAFTAHAADGGAPVIVLAVIKDPAAGDAAGRLPGVTRVALTPDQGDVHAIERRVTAAYRATLAGDDRLKWEDRGWLLAWPAAFLVLFWFRRGWTMRWGAAVVVALHGLAGDPARAEGLADWFLTPDQQGQIAYRDKRFGDAADLFTDPVWKGHALYRAGRYEEAAKILARLDTSDAAFTAGMSHIKSRGYRDAIRSFEIALKRDPKHAAAARNLEIARAILKYVEEAREASDTGEEAGIGADDVVFDNEEGKGADTQMKVETDKAPGLESAEMWMRSVDTNTGDFLRSRFLLESSRSGE